MEKSFRNLAQKAHTNHKLTLPEWQLLEANGLAQREAGDAEVQFTSNGRVESGYELTGDGRKLAGTE